MENDTNCKAIHHQVFFSEDNIFSDYTYTFLIIGDRFHVYSVRKPVLIIYRLIVVNSFPFTFRDTQNHVAHIFSIYIIVT